MLILASNSPRRAEILRILGCNFAAEAADVDESLPEGTLPETAVTLLAARKAAAVLALRPNDTVLGADTVVALDGKILGKPRDAAHAAEMLRQLSGRTHTVYTGVCLLSGGKKQCFCAATEVEFYPLTGQLIADYIATGEPLDKAGSYGIQGRGCVLVKRINGDFFTVMGLPAAQTFRALQQFGICE